MHLHITRLLGALGLFVAGSAARALPPDLSLQQLHHTRWTAENGAPSKIFALAQTGDDALWVGSQHGLFRFDGLRFHRFQAGNDRLLSHGDISALLTAADGSLWIGHRKGGVYRWQGGKLQVFGPEEGLRAGASVLSLAALQDGRIVAALPNGAYILDEGRWRLLGPEAADSPATPYGQPVLALLVDRQGLLWVGSRKGVFTWKPGAPGFERVTAGLRCRLTMTADEAIWCSTDEQTRVSPIRPAPAGPGLGSLQLDLKNALALGDRDGGLWLGSAGALVRLPAPAATLAAGTVLPVAGTAQTFAPAQGLSGNLIDALFEDREGNLWVGTNGGLDRFRRPRLTRVPQERLFDASMLPLADGIVSCSHWHGAGARPATATSARWMPDYCHAAHLTRQGVIWLGGDQGLRRVEAGVAADVALPEAMKGFLKLTSISSDSEGGVWVVAVPKGAFRFKDGAWTRATFPGMPTHAPQWVHGDPQSGVWLGYTRNRLVRLDGDQVRMYQAEDGLDIGTPQAMLVRPEGAVVGGQSGLGLVREGRVLPLRGSDGEAFTGTSGLVEDAEQNLWINCSAGVLRVTAAELKRAIAQPGHALAFERFDHRDGLLGEASQIGLPSALRHPNGLLWFSTGRGVVTIDPLRIARNARAPTVEILGLRADGQVQPLQPGAQLAQKTSRVEIDYTAFSLSVPERVRFRYRLEGVDDQWQEAGDRRLAVYTNLGPGSYRFRVTAANEDGVWHPEGAGFEFGIAPAFYQTTWFRALAAALGALGLWGLHRLRLHQATARVRARIEARAQERERIARELHDTLLQGTQGLILSFGAIAQQVPAEAAARARLEGVLSRAEAVMDEGRRRVLDLRTSGPADGVELADAIASSARLAPELGPLPLAQVRGSPCALQPWAYEELCSLGQEALLNARRHARASRVEVTVDYGERVLALSIKDDGQGIAPQWLEPDRRDGHWGLIGMRERAQRLGAELHWRRPPEGGTEVTLTVAARRVYAARPRPSLRALWARLRPWRRGGQALRSPA